MAIPDVVKADWVTDLVELCAIRLPILLLTSSRRRGILTTGQERSVIACVQAHDLEVFHYNCLLPVAMLYSDSENPNIAFGKLLRLCTDFALRLSRTVCLVSMFIQLNSDLV